MREPREFDMEWEGRRCIVHELSARDARSVARRIGNILGAAIKDGAAAGIDKDVQIAGMMAGGALLERLDEATVEWLTQTFVKATQIEREPGSDEWLSPKDVSEFVFGGSDGLARWLRWMAFCLDMTCSDFFAVAFTEFQKRMKATGMTTTGNGVAPTMEGAAASPSPSTSKMHGTFTA